MMLGTHRRHHHYYYPRYLSNHVPLHVRAHLAGNQRIFFALVTLAIMTLCTYRIVSNNAIVSEQEMFAKFSPTDADRRSLISATSSHCLVCFTAIRLGGGLGAGTSYTCDALADKVYSFFSVAHLSQFEMAPVWNAFPMEFENYTCAFESATSIEVCGKATNDTVHHVGYRFFIDPQVYHMFADMLDWPSHVSMCEAQSWKLASYVYMWSDCIGPDHPALVHVKALPWRKCAAHGGAGSSTKTTRSRKLLI